MEGKSKSLKSNNIDKETFNTHDSGLESSSIYIYFWSRRVEILGYDKEIG